MAIIIEIEGTDGSGKQTQSTMLFNALKQTGLKCCLHSFPSYGSLSAGPVTMYLGGELGDSADCLDGYQTSSLFAVDRLATMKQINVDDYDYVLMDRYTPSNMIHQSTRIKDKQELDIFLNWLEDFEYGKLKLPKPDKILFLDMPVEYSIQLARARSELKNGQARDILEEDSSHLFTAYERAKYVAEKFNWTTISCVDKKLKTIVEIHLDILTKLSLK